MIPAMPWSPDQVPETPFYIYSEANLEKLWRAYQEALGEEAPHVHTHFALKSNNNPDVLNFFKRQGCGLDLVSGFELDIGLAAGFMGKAMIFSGVGKSRAEVKKALQAQVEFLIVESSGELARVEEVAAELGVKARVAFRVNPDVDARTHPYISTGLHEHKFGIDFAETLRLVEKSKTYSHVEIFGLSMHIGSQMLDLSALHNALELALQLARDIKSMGQPLEILDVGGGLGVPYQNSHELPPFTEYGKILQNTARRWRELQGSRARLYTELGRALVAQAGFLVTRVLGFKENQKKNFLIVDASMTELLRPALYQAVHPIRPWQSSGLRGRNKIFDVVGPVCESSDVLGRDREFSAETKEGEVLLIECAGAYGYVMASHYNGRSLPAEYWLNAQGTARLSRAAIGYKI